MAVLFESLQKPSSICMVSTVVPLSQMPPMGHFLQYLDASLKSMEASTSVSDASLKSVEASTSVSLT